MKPILILLFVLISILPISAQWTSMATNVYLTTLSNDVGIGTSTPSDKLEVKFSGADGITITGDGSGDARLKFANNFGGLHFIFSDASDGNALDIESYSEINLNTDGNNERMTILTNGDIRMDGTSPPTFFLDNSEDRIGLGTTTPEALLDVRGNIHIEGNSTYIDFNSTGIGQHGIRMNDNGSFMGGLFLSESGDHLNISNSGGSDGLVLDFSNNRVGIGEDSPEAALEVNVSSGNAILIDGPNSIDVGLKIENGVGTHHIYDNVSGGHNLTLQSANDLRIQTGSGSHEVLYADKDLGDIYIPNHLYIGGSINDPFNNDAALVRLYDTATDDGTLMLIQNSGTGKDILDGFQFGLSQGATPDVRFMNYESTPFTWHVINGGSLYEALRLTNTGRVGIGTDDPQFTLQVDGDVDITGVLTAASDLQLKENIEELDNSLDLIQELRPVSYDFRTNEYPDLNLPEDQKMGFVAQEVEKIIPELVVNSGTTVNNKGKEIELKSVNYIELIPLLVGALQDLENQQNAELIAIKAEKEKEISDLNSRIKLLEDQVNMLMEEMKLNKEYKN